MSISGNSPLEAKDKGARMTCYCSSSNTVVLLTDQQVPSRWHLNHFWVGSI
jgi:hypothetical protein